MKVICILCDKPFQPDKLTMKKIKKYPHIIQICKDCHDRVKERTLQRMKVLPPEPERPSSNRKRNHSSKH
ncbi:DUF2197 domain-containing protein [Staphylospora marina]|uniref:DUF2197 domain-containing protein n=1 Tax=Staphylospora marina TaxID=2490858 RepID=UPI000F5BEA56|nr:DUF2197 domain-containing protein [Staphylospora marina]